MIRIILTALMLAPLISSASVTVQVNGQNHTIPQTNEKGWGTNVTTWIQAISANTLQPNGGNFTLTSDANFGANYGLLAPYYKSRSSNLSTVGVFRLGKLDTIGFRNNANSGDLLLGIDGSDNLVFNGQILPNASAGEFSDAGFRVYNSSDTTKKVSFDISGLTGASTRSIIFPDYDVDLGALVNQNINANAAIDYSKLNLAGNITNTDITASAGISLSKLATLATGRALGTNGSGVITSTTTTAVELGRLSGVGSAVCGISDACTLTNKTLTSPLGILKGDVGLGNVDNTSDATKNSAAVTLSNKTLTEPVIDIGVLTEQSSDPSTPSSGKKKLYAKDDGKLYTKNSSGLVIEVGSGSGEGGINFITNSNAETDASDWNVYADAAAATPVDGTGGTAHVTLTRNTSNPLRGTGDFLFHKDAVNRQGEGFSTDFNVDYQDTENTSKQIYITFDYVTGSSFTQGDALLFIKDLSGNLITPKCNDGTNTLIKSSTPNRMTCVFDTVSGHRSYRLIGHVATTNATDWDVWFDTVKAEPTVGLPGFIHEETKSATCTSSWTANTTTTCKVTRYGSWAEIEFSNTLTGAPTAANLTFNLPSGMVIDTTKLTGIPATSFYIDGSTSANRALTSVRLFPYYASSTSVGAAYVGTATAASQIAVSATAPVTWASGDIVTVKIKVPISGWVASNFMSSAALNAQTPPPITATSSVKTPSGNAHYHALSGNSITIPTGRHVLKGKCKFANSGSSPAYASEGCDWYGSNGADTASEPSTALSSVVTVESVRFAGLNSYLEISGSQQTIDAPETTVRCLAASCTIYLVTYATMTTPSNARVTVGITAQKLPDFTVLGAYSIPPTVQRFTASGTYTTPVGVKYIRVRMCGNGGGGAGSTTTAANNATSGGAGGSVTFGSLLTAGGGSAGTAGGIPRGGAGGTTTTINSPAIQIRVAPGNGGSAGATGSLPNFPSGGIGGGSPFAGGAGPGAGATDAGTAGGANTGAGGGGGSPTTSINSYPGGGGGSGACLEAQINNPSTTYSVTFGSQGSAGAAGTSGAAGSLGALGFVDVEEHY